MWPTAPSPEGKVLFLAKPAPTWARTPTKRGNLPMTLHRSLLLAVGCTLLASAAQAQAVFDMIDRDKDGFVSRAELDGERTARFQMLDRNADGVVDRQEMLVGPGQGRRGYSAGEAQAMLATYDMDGDATINPSEIAESLSRTDVFTNMDTNGDGRLDREEAAGALDTRPRAGIPQDQIVADLSQGVRERAGFRPITAATPSVEVASPYGHSDVDAALANGPLPMQVPPTSTTIPRWDGDSQGGWMGPQGPALAPWPGSEQLPEARDGYVGRMVDPQSGTMPMWQEGAVPPGEMGGTVTGPGPDQGMTGGSNWRVVDNAPMNDGFVATEAPLSTDAPKPRRGLFARIFGN